ncbi:phosphodiester glycosidase family protein [Bacillus songklensis]|uniref:phosphodiester glycosidase family protein n=1 Tax=Bacillus songklensis TaxID=1069116 RepID=UPI00366F8A99
MRQYNPKKFKALFALPAMAAVALTAAVTPPIMAHPSVVQASETAEKSLPLGNPSLAESREETKIAPGLTHTHITRGYQSEKDVFIVDVGFFEEKQEAQLLMKKLEADGYDPRMEIIHERASDDNEKGPLGYLVRIGSFKEEKDAATQKDELKGKGYDKSRVVYSGGDGGKTTGPWAINVLEIDPTKFTGKITPELGTEAVPGKEKLTSIAARTKALAAVNGGYFVMGPNDGTEGDLAGVSMMNGHLISEAVNGRTSLILSNQNAKIAAVETHLQAIVSDGAKREIDGYNRKPGLIRGCGGIGDTTDTPKHDFTCTDPGELIVFTPAFGQTTEPGEGVEVVLNSAKEVMEVRDHRGGKIPNDGMVLSGKEDAADWLLSHAKPGTKMDIDNRILADGKPLPVDKTVGIVNGGPRLLQHGRVNIDAANEGFHWNDNPEFYYRFGERRNPRTLAGVTNDGKILLVTIDGHQPGYSVGANFEESARIMQALGAKDAVNLDGGGSTTMTIGSELINRPSDSTGERPIGDAIVLLP